MKKNKILTSVLATTLMVSACNRKYDKPDTASDKDQQVSVTVSDKMDSESLALAGEQLVNGYTFMLADKAIDMALAKDANNKRAQFWKAFLKPWMTTKGTLNRGVPYAAAYADLKQYKKTSEDMSQSPLRDFLLDGPQDIKNMADIQSLVASMRDGFNEFRNFLKTNSDMEIVINMNPYVFRDKIDENARKSCQVVSLPDGGYTVTCDTKNIMLVKLNNADFLALAQIAAGWQLYLTLLTSHGLKGTEELIQDSSNGIAHSNAYVIRKLEGNSDFGALLKDQKLTTVVGLGADFSAAAKWAIRNSSSLCPSRDGYLFEGGLCVEDKNHASEQIALLDTVLAGVVVADLQNSDGQTVKNVKVDYLSIARNPVQNLVQLFPNTFNQNGQAVGLKDKTFGGTFPDGNADDFIIKH